MAAVNYVGAWHIRPTPAEFEGRPGIKNTWTGPIKPELYGGGLKSLCDRTKENLARLSCEMQKVDPCLEYGMKHWHPTARPKSADSRLIKRPPSSAKWENMDVMFADNSVLDSLSMSQDAERDSYMDPPQPGNKFCYFCSTMEEHKRHMLHHRPKKRPASAKPKVTYIAPTPKQKKKVEEEEIQVKERLYKVEVYTSDIPNAGTSANVFISIKGSEDVLTRTQLKKNRGCSKLCFVRASKEVFHLKGPFLGNLQILTIEHDGKTRSQGWFLDRVEVTDVKIMKTWLFACSSWLSMYEKPHFSQKLDLKAHEKEKLPTVYSIEVYTGKAKMAGTDAKIYLTLFGDHGNSKKVHLADTSSGKKLFERKSVDKFKIQMNNVGDLRSIRVEHDGQGFGAGWFLDKIIITDSERPKDVYYFIYNGWIAKDEGEGKLWRDIKAKKSLPKEIKEGEKTKYQISVKTGDVRYAGTDANVFIQMCGTNNITPKVKLDDAKNNFERNTTDVFDIDAINVGPLKSITIGHDNFGPGAGWYLEKVEIRRNIPKAEALERLKKMKKRLKKEQREKIQRKKNMNRDEGDEMDDEDDKEFKTEKKKSKKDKKLKKEKKNQNFFSVSSESSSDSSYSDSSDDEDKKKKKLQRPGSAMSRTSQRSEDRQGIKERHGSSASSERRPGSAAGRPGSARRISTSLSGLEKLAIDKKLGRAEKDDADDDDDRVKELKVPLYEQYLFEANCWLAKDEGDGKFVRELPVKKKTVYYKE